MMTFHRMTAYASATLLIAISLGQTMCKTPLLRIIELNCCRSYYKRYNPELINQDGYVDEELCKNASIQEELATINGVNIFLQSTIGRLFYTSHTRERQVRLIPRRVSNGFHLCSTRGEILSTIVTSGQHF